MLGPQLRMGFLRELVGSGDRVLLVDDWVATGAQAETCRQLVAAAGATWLGTSVIVDALERPELRRLDRDQRSRARVKVDQAELAWADG